MKFLVYIKVCAGPVVPVIISVDNSCKKIKQQEKKNVNSRKIYCRSMEINSGANLRQYLKGAKPVVFQF